MYELAIFCVGFLCGIFCWFASFDPKADFKSLAEENADLVSRQIETIEKQNRLIKRYAAMVEACVQINSTKLDNLREGGILDVPEK